MQTNSPLRKRVARCGMIGALALFVSAGCATSKHHRLTMDQLRAYPIDSTVLEKADERIPLSLNDITHLSTNNVPPDLIIDVLKENRAIYELKTTAIDRLRENGVNDEVINYLLSTPQRYPPREYYYYGPWYYPPYPYYYPYPPPVYFHYHRHYPSGIHARPAPPPHR